MHRITLLAPVVLTLCLGSSISARASVRVLSDEALAVAAGAAVHGRVVAVESRRGPSGSIHSYVTLDVLEAWGTQLPSRVVLKQLGGRVGDVELVVGGAPQFTPGEEVFVFVEVRDSDGTLMVAGMEQGKWHVSDVPTAAGDRAADRAFDAHQRVRERRALRELRRLAARAGGPGKGRGRPVVAVPAELALPAVEAGGVGIGAAGEWTYLIDTTPARWHEADASLAVPLDTESANPYVPGGGLAQLANAGSLWTNAGALTLPLGATRSARCFDNAEPPDGRISVAYTDPCREISSTSSTLALGGFYWSSGRAKAVNGITFQGIAQGMVVLDDTPSKFANGLGCYEQVLTHELGHAIGFGHSSDPASIMYPVITGCTSRTTSRPLGQSELNALAAVYPVSAPGAPTGLQAVTSGSALTLQWGAPAGKVAGYEVEGIAPGLPPQAFDLGTAMYWAITVPDGTYRFRVRARNSAGYGPYSPEAVAIVAAVPAVPLSAPRDFQFEVTGSIVAMTWAPPASGAAISYVLEAGSAPGLGDAAVTTVNSAALTVPGVPPGTYWVRVRGVNASGAGPATSDVAITVAPPALPPAPTGLTATVVQRTVQLWWTPPAGGASGYVLEAGYAPGLANAAVARTVAPGVLATGVPPGVYYVRVRAVTAAGAGPLSDEIVVTVP